MDNEMSSLMIPKGLSIKLFNSPSTSVTLGALIGEDWTDADEGMNCVNLSNHSNNKVSSVIVYQTGAGTFT